MSGGVHLACDVAIVGGRVAGSILASLVGDAGLRVIVLERDPPGTDTLSTHYTTGEGLVGMHARLGVLDEVLALGPPPLVCEYRFYGGAAEPVVIPTHSPGRIGFALSVRRRPLDAILQRRAARSPGVTLLHRHRATALRWHGAGVCGVTAQGPDGLVEIDAGLVVGADGRHSSVARWVAAPVEREDPVTRSLLFRYLRGYRGPDGRMPDGSEFSLREDTALYAFPSDDDTTCLALSLPVAEFRAGRDDPDATYARQVALHRGLARRAAAASPVDDRRVRGTLGTPNWVRLPYGPGWALVGDAGLHLDPWTGRGMDFAATHAGFLADAIAAWRAGADQEASLAGYAAARDAHALDTYRFTIEGARDLRPYARHEAWGIPALPGPPPGRYPAEVPATRAAI